MKIILIFVFIIKVLCVQSTTPKLITKIPRYNGKMDYQQWSGYVTTDEKHGRNLYYVFVESENPKDPLVLWLQGGPGCSGIMAYMTEHGPFQLSDDGVVAKNPYSLVGLGLSVIYVDSPGGVGYGYDEDYHDFLSGSDNRTTNDLYLFLQEFLTNLFPKYRPNEFYVFGESYGGIYIPWITNRIDEENESGTQPKINLKGMMMSNAVVKFKNYYETSPIWMMGHSVISIEQYNNALDACEGEFYYNMNLTACANAWKMITHQQIGLNVLDLFTGCYNGIKHDTNDPMVDCINTNTSQDYFNSEEAYEDFGVSPKFHNTTKYWWMCSEEVQWGDHYITTKDDMIPWLRKLFKKGYRIMIANGDTDMTVNTLCNQHDFNEIVSPYTTTDWIKWYTCNSDDTTNTQIAGWFRNYKNIYLATIKGAGHMISSYKPYRSWHLYKRWLEDSFDKKHCNMN